MPRYLVLSIVASIMLTVLVNLVLWIFPRVGERFEESFRRAVERAKPAPDETSRSAVRVLFRGSSCSSLRWC